MKDDGLAEEKKGRLLAWLGTGRAAVCSFRHQRVICRSRVIRITKGAGQYHLYVLVVRRIKSSIVPLLAVYKYTFERAFSALLFALCSMYFHYTSMMRIRYERESIGIIVSRNGKAN